MRGTTLDREPRDTARCARRTRALRSTIALSLTALALSTALGVALLGGPWRVSDEYAPARAGLLQGRLAEEGLLRVRIAQRGWLLEATGSVDTAEQQALVSIWAGRLAPGFEFANRTTVHEGRTQLQVIGSELWRAGLSGVRVSDAQGPIVTEGAVHTHYEQQLLRDIVRTHAPGRDHLDATFVTPW